jgi:hypothetical protein
MKKGNGKYTKALILGIGFVVLGIGFCFVSGLSGCGSGKSPAPITSYMSEKREIIIAGHMPYSKVKINNSEGYFLIDYGTTDTRIDTNAFPVNDRPKRVPGTPYQFDSFQFFDTIKNPTIYINDYSNIKNLGSIKQAGIIGTDFLSTHIFMLDYEGKAIYKANPNTFCPDSILYKEGYRAASTKGYFSNDRKKLLNDSAVNVPTVRISIGNAEAEAQIDPGFDSGQGIPVILVNQALFDAMIAHGTVLTRVPKADGIWTTCVPGVTQKIEAYSAGAASWMAILGADGNPVVVLPEIRIYLKKTPTAVQICGGVGIWETPAAQIGSSFLISRKKVIFDPFKSQVWFYTK